MAAPPLFGTAPLGVVPRGLLDFLKIKSMGQYPQRLSADIVPVFELVDWYAATNQEIWQLAAAAQATAAPGAGFDWVSSVPSGLAMPLVVPNNEFWYVLHYQCKAQVPGAADLVQVQPRLIINGLGPSVLRGTNVGQVVAGANGMSNVGIAEPFFAPPGSTLQGELLRCTTATTATLTGTLRVCRLQA